MVRTFSRNTYEFYQICCITYAPPPAQEPARRPRRSLAGDQQEAKQREQEYRDESSGFAKIAGERIRGERHDDERQKYKAVE
jgi:hypothetical protein